MIWLILGGQGSGKTLFLTSLGYHYHKQGRTVYSNFKLGYPYKELQFKDIIDFKVNDSCILLDEAPLWGLDARSGLNKLNKKITSQFISQCRKQGVDLFASTQRERLIDVRVREHADVLAECKKYVFVNDQFCNTIQSKVYAEDIPVKVVVNLTQLDDQKSSRIILDANKIYPLYDTRQTIKLMEDPDDDTKKKFKKVKKKGVKDAKKTVKKKDKDCKKKKSKSKPKNKKKR